MAAAWGLVAHLSAASRAQDNHFPNKQRPHTSSERAFAVSKLPRASRPRVLPAVRTLIAWFLPPDLGPRSK